MRSLLAAALFSTLALATPLTLLAQEEEEEGPGSRVVTVTTFQVPFADRPQVLPWMLEYFAPGTQLNPNVIGFRILFHNWGSDASQVIMVSEYENFSDIEADCGQPCDDYFDEHPAPEEGDEGYEEYQEGLELFNKYYSHHSDEIYVSPMGVAKVEGEMVGTVGPPPEEPEEPEENEGN